MGLLLSALEGHAVTASKSQEKEYVAQPSVHELTHKKTKGLFALKVL